MDSVSTNQEARCQARRTANYKPNIWNYDHLQSCLSAKYDEEMNKYEGEAEILREEVRCIIGASNDPIHKLELIDGITKLGISYYFEEEINKSIEEISCKQSTISLATEHNDLYSIALYFRVLRQHGYHVSQDGVLQMLDDENKITTTHLDEKDMVEVYEASHLALEGEYGLLDRVKAFIAARNIDSTKCPSHWSVIWFNVKEHIRAQDESTLHRLAGLSFNMVQVQHQKDLNETLTWWKKLGLSEALTFTRDRAVESFLWTVGVAYEPQYGMFRKWFTKAIILVLVIDDMYDIYGSEDELEQFTVAVERWDPKEIRYLPGAIKRCFWALYDTVNEMDIDIQKQKGWNSVLPHLKKVWAGFCKALYKEAEWYHKGHCPSLCEYLENGWISSSGPLLSLHTLLGVGQDITRTMAAFNDNQQLIHHASLIIRLYNDQATSKAELERGDAPSSILCRMRDTNATEQEARDHIWNLITESWGKMNELFIKSCPHSQQPMVRYILNLARVVNFIYQNGDGYGVQDRETRKQVLSCLIEPLPLP